MTKLRFLLALVLAAAAVVFLPATALACSCLAPEGTQAQRDEAEAKSSKAVFAGTVTAITDENSDAKLVSSGDPIAYEFDVDTLVKGDVDNQQVVFSSRDGASCGFNFEKGRRYLVFAYEGSGKKGVDQLWAGLCSQTRELEAGEDVALAGAVTTGGDTETDGGVSPPVPDDGTSWIPIVLTLAVAAVVAGGAAVVVSRARTTS